MSALITSPSALRLAAQAELTTDILPFWVRHGFEPDGRMAGMVTNRGERIDEVPRHAVICARVLWTYAAALGQLGPDPTWRHAAELARAQLLGPFWDARHGGVFWSLDATGRVISDRKQIYAQAFAIYGLAQWHAATGDREALARACELFSLVDEHSHDAEQGGYIEACAADWRELEDLRLSEIDKNVPKTMNTLLHLLEAFTTLLRVWPDPRLRQRLAELTGLFVERIYTDHPIPHCQLFFQRGWETVGRTISFGHDIETSWLLGAAAGVLADATLQARVDKVAGALADAVLVHGTDADGGVFYEAEDRRLSDPDKHWWPQAEAVVGFLNAHALTGEQRFGDAAWRTWQFIEDRIVDREFGEWRSGVDRVGRPKAAYPEFRDGYKIGPWKCPYHNGRACLEILRRVPA